jgi:ATPase subunit of ABC transporter with duplicated ATPase domains
MEHVRSVATGETDQTLRSVLGHFLLADKVEQPAGTLSGGEKTKLALAQLVIGRHNVLLLDEPTNNLDPQAKEALLAALHAYTGTIVLVSHDTDFVAAVWARIGRSSCPTERSPTSTTRCSISSLWPDG